MFGAYDAPCRDPECEACENEVSMTFGGFGVVWQLARLGVVIDTYCPWNGDERPKWMADAGAERDEG